MRMPPGHAHRGHRGRTGLTELRNAAVLLSLRRRDFATAVRLAEQARIAGVADAILFGLKGHALSGLGRHAEAADAYAEALKLDPDDRYVRHLVAAAGACLARSVRRPNICARIRRLC